MIKPDTTNDETPDSPVSSTTEAGAPITTETTTPPAKKRIRRDLRPVAPAAEAAASADKLLQTVRELRPSIEKNAVAMRLALLKADPAAQEEPAQEAEKLRSHLRNLLELLRRSARRYEAIKDLELSELPQVHLASRLNYKACQAGGSGTKIAGLSQSGWAAIAALALYFIPVTVVKPLVPRSALLDEEGEEEEGGVV